MSDLEYNMSYDLAKIMREQGEIFSLNDPRAMTELDLKEHTEQMKVEEDSLMLQKEQEGIYSTEEIEADIESYWNRQDEYFCDGWWLDKDKKEEAFNMLLLESLLIEGEDGKVGGYDLIEHYTSCEPGSPKRQALQILFQLEPIDGDDEIVLNNIAGACAREQFDLVANGWVIPPEIMQKHAANYEQLQAQVDMNEKSMLSFAFNFIPGVGEVKSGIEAYAGYDVFTGEEMSGYERALGVAAGFADALYFLKIGKIGKAGKGMKYTEEALETSETAGKLDELAPSTPVKEIDNMSTSDNLTPNEKMIGSEGGLKTAFVDNITDILKKEGLTLDEFNALRVRDVSTLTDAEIATLKAIRESVPMPDTDTLMQKVIPAGDIEKYMDGTYTQVGGFVTRAEDVMQLKNYDDIYNSLRLDYPNTAYDIISDDSLAVIRYTTSEPSKFDIPFSSEFGGVATGEAPFTGNGFTKATNGQIIPEYKCSSLTKIDDGAQLIEIGKDGTETVIAIYDVDFGRFIPIDI